MIQSLKLYSNLVRHYNKSQQFIEHVEGRSQCTRERQKCFSHFAIHKSVFVFSATQHCDMLVIDEADLCPDLMIDQNRNEI